MITMKINGGVIVMKGFHMDADPVRLYFTNYERRPDEEEFAEILGILKKHNVIISDKIMGPDCDLFKCNIKDVEFNLIYSIDGEGSFIYCDDSEGMKFLESLFDMK